MSEHEKMLLWLADCEAATLQHLQTPEVRRHKSICESIKEMIEKGVFSERESTRERVLERLKAATTYEAK